MNYLDRNTLPKFQERLDLAASELNDAEDILVAAINELAGRAYILSAMVPESERSQYAEESSFPLLDKIALLQTQIDSLSTTVEELRGSYDEQMETFDSRLTDIEVRLNALDDAAARKEDLNVILYRTGEIIPDPQPSTCYFTYGTYSTEHHPPRLDSPLSLKIENPNKDQLKHTIKIMIAGVVVDSIDNAIFSLGKGVDNKDLILSEEVYAPFIGRTNLLEVEVTTRALTSYNTWSVIGTTVTKFTIVG
jgi:hypothetical protein